jgi:hypothetical protein
VPLLEEPPDEEELELLDELVDEPELLPVPLGEKPLEPPPHPASSNTHTMTGSSRFMAQVP